MLVIEMPGAKQDPRLVVQESKPLCMSDIAKAIQKSDPNGIGLVNSISLVARMSTGVFPIDYQTGGGWLAGRINILWAKEGAGKTLLTLLTIRADQILNPTKTGIGSAPLSRTRITSTSSSLLRWRRRLIKPRP